MIGKRKIFINVAATYMRSVYGLFLGIFSARWALCGLGEVNYGLAGLVGGMALFVSFINELLSFSIVRFYGISVGAALKEKNTDYCINESRKWFNAAITIHATIPVVLVAVGYPIGDWAINNFLEIPVDKLDACVWVWRLTCISCFVGMLSVPFNAMYIAKQDIAELTVYDVSSATAKAIFLLYISTHPRDWLVGYAVCLCLVSVIPNVMKVSRACLKYRECRVVSKYLIDMSRMKDIAIFGAARFWTMFSNLVSNQGNAIVVNKFLGPVFNATLAISNTVVLQTATLSNSLNGAFWPAITNVAGAGDEAEVKRLSYGVCIYGSVLMLIFVIPLCLELDTVLALWLKSPPPFVSNLCLAALVAAVIERMTEGLYMPIMALNRGVRRYSFWVGWCGFSSLGIAFTLMSIGCGMLSLCVAIIAGKILLVILRLILSKNIVDMSILYWFKRVLFPIVVVSGVSAFVGSLTHVVEPCFARVVLTTLVSVLVFATGVWCRVFSAEERIFVREKALSKIMCFCHRKGASE